MPQSRDPDDHAAPFSTPEEEVRRHLATALEHHHHGRLGQAEAHYRTVLERDPAHLQALSQYAVLAQGSGRNDLAIRLLRQALHHHPQAARLYTNLGEIYRRQGRFEEALAPLQRAITLAPDRPEAHVVLGMVHQAQGDLDAAVACFRQAIRLQPDFAVALNNLGLALQEQGRPAEAEDVLRRVLVRHPDHVNALYNLGNLLGACGRPEEAIAVYRRAVALAPDFAEAHANLGAALRTCGRYEEALTALRQAVALTPTLPGLYTHLGAAQQALGRIDEAVAHYRRALERTPDDPDGLYNLGSCLKSQAHLGEAEQLLRRALALAPEHAEARLNLGNVLRAQGRVDEAIRQYRAVLRAAPDHRAAHSNLLLALNYAPMHTPEAVYAEHCAWAEQHTGPLPPRPRIRHDGSRRLRIGYVSPDFREHSVAYFIEPVLRSHDRSRFTVFAYAQVPRPDATTERLRACVDTWHDVTRMNDAAVADRIRADAIDVLVDLAGHTGDNRLGVFGQRPAPVQISYLGYPNTTGLAAMDYRLTDAHADPENESDPCYSETLIRLDPCFLCYRAPAESPGVAPPPNQQKGAITFGSFNALPKLTEEVLATWAEILRRVPGARLLLKSPSFEDAQTRERYRRLFDAAPLARERITLHGFVPDTAAHLALYHEVDIALDPFPYNGTTTTCEALWMGVPVVSLAGRRHAARVGLSILTQVGLADLCAETKAAYIEHAVRLAADRNRLPALRSALRDRMRTSPLCDARRFTRHLEHVYQDLVQRVIHAPPPTPHDAL